MSKKLHPPLPFDRSLAQKLSLEILFKKGFTGSQCISSATRQWRQLSDNDVDVLLSEIKRVEGEGLSPEAILSTDEVLEIRELVRKENSFHLKECLWLYLDNPY